MSEIRTPPSLKWLINRRARLAGELKKLQDTQAKELEAAENNYWEAKKEFEQAEKNLSLLKLRYERTYKALKTDLEAIDNTLSQHEIQISPELITPIIPQKAERIVPYGKITSAIFNCLKCANGDSVSTTDIAISILESFDRKLAHKEFMKLRKSVAKRLKNLCSDGKVVKTNKSQNSVEGRWRLPVVGPLHEPLQTDDFR